jgi:hypothetical protein
MPTLMTEPIDADLADKLAELEPTDLQSLLLETYRRRSARRSPADLLSDYERSRFFGAGGLHPDALAQWDDVARAGMAEKFENLILSPMTPLGTCSTVATVGQDWSVPTVRTGEVVSDPTNVLALEAAIRRREILRKNPKANDLIHLGTTHRVVRPQAYKNPKMLAHFSLFALVSAGRDQGNFAFEAEALSAHLEFYLPAFRRYLGETLRLRITYTLRTASHEDARLMALREITQRHAIALVEDPDRKAVHGYYTGFCFHIWGGLQEDALRQLADGGTVDWGAKLLSNAKERMLISGTGVDGLAALRDAAISRR